MGISELLAAIARGKGSHITLMTEAGRRGYTLIGSFGKADGLDRTYHILVPENGISPAEVWCFDIAEGDVYAAREDCEDVIAKVMALLHANAEHIKGLL